MDKSSPLAQSARLYGMPKRRQPQNLTRIKRFNGTHLSYKIPSNRVSNI